MLLNKINNCDLSEEDKLNLSLILEGGDSEFVQNYLKEIKMKKSTAVKNLPTMEICKLYEMGWSVKAIADKYDCTTNSITKHLPKGGYSWDKYQARWIKGQQQMTKPTSVTNKGKQREFVNWILSGAYEKNVITVEIFAKEFNCTRDQGSNCLSYLAKKHILGMENIGRGIYQFELPSKSELPKHSIPRVLPESSEDKSESILTSGIDIKKINELAKEVGGLEKLNKITSQLIEIKKSLD